MRTRSTRQVQGWAKWERSDEQQDAMKKNSRELAEERQGRHVRYVWKARRASLMSNVRTLDGEGAQKRNEERAIDAAT